MNIVLEGPDGSGKSTLAAAIVDAIPTLRLQQGNGPPKSATEICERARSYLAMHRTLFDRHPCVSEPIYGAMRGDVACLLDARIIAEFYASRPLLIYCRGTDVSNHVVKPGEDPAHVAALTARYDHVVAAYDAWALHHATIMYRIGDDVSYLIDVLGTLA